MMYGSDSKLCTLLLYNLKEIFRIENDKKIHIRYHNFIILYRACRGISFDKRNNKSIQTSRKLDRLKGIASGTQLIFILLKKLFIIVIINS